MKKMRLNPDQLAVESFSTDTRDRRVRGTVQARQLFSDQCASANCESTGCEDDTMANCTEGCYFPFLSRDAAACDNRDVQPTMQPGCVA
ncbi:hypothetical protein [Longimicrobium sp.]|uniref:hypothetical protein n=1 Tax=Longimicrobium sp. TaxID=2029185 RepID=UPI003B3AC6B0